MSVLNLDRDKDGIIVKHGCLFVTLGYRNSHSRISISLLEGLVEWINETIEKHSMDCLASCCSIGDYAIFRHPDCGELGFDSRFSVVFVPGVEILGTVRVDFIRGGVRRIEARNEKPVK